MVNRRLRSAAVLSLLREAARRHHYRVAVETGKGTGSHQLVTVVGEDGREVGRAALPGHVRALSWAALGSIEAAFAPSLGERWMEER